jgi:hypothetical protein
VAEYQATVSDVVQGSSASGITADFGPDSRQGGFTVNEAQRVDPVLARQLSDAATKLAADVRSGLPPCAAPSTPDQCADAFLRDFGGKAYRRPLADDEVQHLLTVFHAGVDGGSYEEGIELATRAMLQSAAFLYHTEIGEASAATVKLTPYELASSISYLMEGGPPSAALVASALKGELDTAAGRKSLMATLFAGNGRAAARVQRVVGEWLGTDKLPNTAKDTTIYQDFAGLKTAMVSETGSFLNAVVGDGVGGKLSTLLSADWTVADGNLLTMYGAGAPDGNGRASTPTRLGILNQAAFLSVYAHAHETAPVLRGVAIMRRVACSPVPDPVDLSMAIVPPVPDQNKTTRERFEVHAQPGCDACHNRIDNFGFAFEGFDGMGKFRPGGMENGKTVDTSVNVVGTDFDGPYASSNELVKAMAKSPQVHACFARQVFHALAATSSETQSENDFVTYWQNDPTNVTDSSVLGTISAFVESPAFNFRRAQ